MNNFSYLLNLLLAVAIILISIKLIRTDENTSAKENAEVEDAFVQKIMTRTSVRKYQDKTIADETVEKILHAAMAAPSAANKQPWQFVVIKDKHLLSSLAGALPHAKMAAHAPVAIAVCGDLGKTLDGDGMEYWVQDASAASENILLAAHSLGLGAVWTGIYPLKDRVAAVQQILGLPSHIVPLNLIPIGYPAESPAPKDKWKAENVHYDSWK